MSDASRSTEHKVESWMRAQREVERTKQYLRNAETELLNATNELGKHMDPGDMDGGESICIWVRVDDKDERLLEVRKEFGKAKMADYTIKFRGKRR